MDAPEPRTVSGRKLVVISLAVIAVITLVGVVYGPSLREDVRQDTRPRTLREPVATGTYDGQVWETVVRFDGTANCVELRYRSEVLDRACDTGPQSQATRIGDDGPTVAYGVAPEGVEDFDVELADGTSVNVPVRAGELGFPVGFWSAELPEGAALAGAN